MRTYTRDEVEVLLSALEAQATYAIGLSSEAQDDAKFSSIAAYLQFRRQFDEFRSLVSIVEHRLQNLEEDQAIVVHLTQVFERLNILVVALASRTSHLIFRTLLQTGALPLGAEVIFAPDMRNLSATRKSLRQASDMHRYPSTVLQDLEGAIAALKEMSAIVPRLIDFDAAPESPDPSPPDLPASIDPTG